MAHRFKELAGKLKNSDKKLKFLIAAGIIGIILIMLSDLPFFNSAESKNISDEYSYDEYVNYLEGECENLIESIEGAGECTVMLTLKNSKESVYARNSEESQNDGSFSSSYEYVLYKTDSSQTPVLIKQYYPQVMGVAIVCAGADNPKVKENIISALTSVFDISTSKISVSKSK